MENLNCKNWFDIIKIIIVLLSGIAASFAQNGPNLRPAFMTGGDLSRFSIPEDTPVGTVVYRLKGSDPENGELTYSISGEYLRVNKKNGDLTLIKELDRETEASIDVIISLTDDGQGGEPETISIRREILITDKNDNPPVFNKRPYSFKVSEQAKVGSTVFSEIVITDDDFGPNAQISFTCAMDESPIACKIFSVSAEEIADGNYVGIITLAAPLDYETHSSFAMTVKANDGDNIATALVAITVIDVQDQSPKFFGGPYVFKVKENSVPGTKVGFISVQDGDTGNPRDVQLRLIDESQNNYFRLNDIKRDSFTGTFSAIVETSDNILDAENDFIRENLGVYELSLEAREYPLSADDTEPTLITRIGVAVMVEDVDDHIPKFTPSLFPRILRIPYNPHESWTFPDFSVQVEDEDVEFSNSQFTLQFDWSLETPIPTDQVFSFVTPTGANPIIQSKSVITLEVLNVSLLQPGSAFDLEIGAYQNGHLVSKLNVPVEVDKGPKILPIFNNTVYRIAIPEDIAEGELITRIAAKNHGEIPDIKYNLIGVGTERFDVDEKTGNIRCGVKNCLDFEKERHHFFLVKAKAGNGVEDEVFALFYVDVLERNDNKPEFHNSLPGFASSMRRSVPDGTTEFDPPFYVTAIDADLNDHITYSLTDHSMNTSGISIEPESGKLMLAKPLRWNEAGEHKLTVTATDKTGKSTSQTVILVVQAVPNIPPSFPFKTHSLEIPETFEIGNVIYRVIAHDPDGQDAALKYYIHSQPEPDLFLIEESTGWVRLNGKLDYETKQRQYTVILRVQDEGKPSEMAIATLDITITDHNDENPKFSMNNYVVDMSESAKVDYSLLTLTAADSDENSTLVYSIHCPCQVWDSSGSMGNLETAQKYFQHLKLDNITGEITLVLPLEHKLSSVLEFQGTVEDKFGIVPQNDSATITLYVTAAERLNPYFGDPWTPGNPWINLTIPEDMEVGRNVVTLNAWDYVADEEIKLFELMDEDTDPFGLEDNVLQVVNPLDYETRKHYIVSVKAVDARGGESIANLDIKLSDQNDNTPVFSKNEYKGKVAENSEYPTPILTVEASDRDDPENYGAIRYALTGPQSHLFTIDELAGVVQVAKGADLDREKDNFHTLYILALDTPAGGPFQRSATATARITITDENDNDPVCQVVGGELFVGETAPVGTRIGNVTCDDPDETSKSKLQYHIRDESQLGLFGIDVQTGSVSVIKSLRGRGRSAPYLIIVVTEDGKERSAITQVGIKIANLIPNDGKPHFTNENWTTTLSEGAFRGTPVLHIRAEDSDSYDNGEGRLTYKLLKQIHPCQSKLNDNKKNHNFVESVDFFRLDEQTGMLTLTDTIDREKHECFSVLISVEDFGTPPQSETQWFEIKVLDSDDNFPFLPKEMRNVELILNETTTPGKIVLNLTANDADIYPNNRVEFEITSIGLATEYFKIKNDEDEEDVDEQSARIVLSGNLKKLEPDEVTFVVKCFPKNKKFTSGSADCSSKVHVKLIRDSDAESGIQNSKVSEMIFGAASGVPVGNLIGNVGLPHSKKKIETSIQMFHPTAVSQSPYNVSEVVRVDSSTGDIFVWDNLDSYQNGHLRVLVSQRESGTNRMTQKRLKIFMASNAYLLMSDTSDYPKVQRWIDEIEAFLNVPRHNSRLNRGVFKLLTFDQSNAPEGKTKVCFQLLENENLVTQEKALQLLNNPDIQDIFLKFSFSDEIQKGCPQQIRTPAKLVVGSSKGNFWVERSLVGIASVVAIATMSAILILCLVNRSRGKDSND